MSELFDEIKNKVSLVTEIESRGINLIHAGRQKLKCRCPFPNHNDNSPSFYVSLNDFPELFYCFGCKKGGSVIDFVMFYGNNGTSEFTQKEAIEYIVKKYSLESLLSFDLERISLLPNKYKKEELPLLSKSLFIAEDIRKFLNKSFNVNQDFKKIKDYMENVDLAIKDENYTELSVLEDLIPKALKAIGKNNKIEYFSSKCKKCNACDLRGYCNNSVFGYGNFDSDTWLIGDYLTPEESRNNRPFSDEAGIFFLEELSKVCNPFDYWMTTSQSCCSVLVNRNFVEKCFEENLRKVLEYKKPKNIIISGEITSSLLKDNIINIPDYRKVYFKELDYKEFVKEVGKIK